MKDSKRDTREVTLTGRTTEGELWAHGIEDYAALCGTDLESFNTAVESGDVDPSDLESVFWFWLQRIRSKEYTRSWLTKRDEFVPEKRTTVKVPVAGKMRRFSVAAKVTDLREWELPKDSGATGRRREKNVMHTAVPVKRGHTIKITSDEVIVSGYDTFYVRYRLFKLGLLWDPLRLLWHCPVGDWEHIEEDVHQALEWAHRSNRRKQDALDKRKKDGDWIE